ncbi:MAG: TraR/DksA family transcriptional regulator [Planctomycetota bacterium]|jgi:RNA polymerase-binding protein DksA
MAKKKVTKKKKRATSARKVAKKPTTRKKAAGGKRKVAKTSAKKTRTTVKKTKTTAKKTKSAAKKTKTTASRTKKTAKVTAKVPAKTTSKKKVAAKAPTRKTSTTKGSSAAQKAAAAKAARPAPDANGYVIINGRRVRMMSAAAVKPVTGKKTRSRVKAAIEPTPEATKDKPVKTKLKKKDLDHFRELLLDRRRELVGDLSAMEQQALQASGSNTSHMPIHMADIGTDTYDQDFMLGLAENERRRLREIDGALGRIQDRTYGVCQMTNKPIPKARLNAKPWARYTIEAARQIERGVGE